MHEGNIKKLNFLSKTFYTNYLENMDKSTNY